MGFQSFGRRCSPVPAGSFEKNRTAGSLFPITVLSLSFYSAASASISTTTTTKHLPTSPRLSHPRAYRNTDSSIILSTKRPVLIIYPVRALSAFEKRVRALSGFEKEVRALSGLRKEGPCVVRVGKGKMGVDTPHSRPLPTGYIMDISYGMGISEIMVWRG